MNKKNGFTLVELIAVIIILSAISLIATPMIINTIDSFEKETAEFVQFFACFFLRYTL